jgi:hypothetical protein
VSERQVGAVPHCILTTKFIGRAAAAQKDSNITDFFTKLPSLFENNGRTHRAPGKPPEACRYGIRRAVEPLFFFEQTVQDLVNELAQDHVVEW